MSDEEVDRGIWATHAELCQVWRRLLAIVGEHDRRGLWQLSGSRNEAKHLERVLDVGWRTAYDWVRVAHALDRQPVWGDWFANGDLSLDKLADLVTLAEAERAGSCDPLGPLDDLKPGGTGGAGGGAGASGAGDPSGAGGDPSGAGGDPSGADPESGCGGGSGGPSAAGDSSADPSGGADSQAGSGADPSGGGADPSGGAGRRSPAGVGRRSLRRRRAAVPSPGGAPIPSPTRPPVPTGWSVAARPRSWPSWPGG